MPPREDPAISRYLYMLRTAPPETIERAHEEAFAQLTPEQRREALQKLADAVPPEERRLLRDDPHSLARAATRTEIREPGVLQRMFGGMGLRGGAGIGMGSVLAGSLLASLAGSFIGSAIADNFLHDHPWHPSDQDPSPADYAVTSNDVPDADDSGLGDDFDSGGDFGGDLTDI
jgi:hypothetical protein